MSIRTAWMPLILVIVMFLAAASPSAVAQTPRAADASCGTFSGGYTQLTHFLKCVKIPYDVVDATNPAAVGKTVTPDAGGPSCQWLSKNLVEECFQRGVGHLICAQYWSGSYYPYHCGPTKAYNITHEEGLWTVVKKLFSSHTAQACYKGAVIGGGSAVVIKLATAAKTTWFGLLVTTVVGCVAGSVNYRWKIK